MALPVEVEDGPALEEAGASTAPTPCFVPTTSPVDNATATPGSFRLSPSLSLFPLSSPLSPPSAQLSLRSSSLPLPLSSYLFPPPLLLTVRSLPPFLEYTAPLSSSSSCYFTFSYLSLLLPLSLFVCIPRERLSSSSFFSSSSSGSTLLASLLRLRLSFSLSLEARERSENGETGETFSLSKLAATDSPLAGNGETVHHVRLKSVTTLHSLMPGLHDQLHFQRGPANYRYDCFRPRGPPDK